MSFLLVLKLIDKNSACISMNVFIFRTDLFDSKCQIDLLTLITARKRSLRRLCLHRCLSVHGGCLPHPLDTTTLNTHPWTYTPTGHPLWTPPPHPEHTLPGHTHTHTARTHPHPVYAGIHTPPVPCMLGYISTCRDTNPPCIFGYR